MNKKETTINHGVDNTEELGKRGQERRKLLAGGVAALVTSAFPAPFFSAGSGLNAKESADSLERVPNGLVDPYAVHTRGREIVRVRDLHELQLAPPKNPEKMLGAGKRGVIVNKTYHRFWLYNGSDKPILTGPALSSRSGEFNKDGVQYSTPEGVFPPLRIEGPNYTSKSFPGADMGFAVFFGEGGEGLHRSGNYARKDGEVYAILDNSHGCINLQASDAETINHYFKRWQRARKKSKIAVYSEKYKRSSDGAITDAVNRAYDSYTLWLKADIDSALTDKESAFSLLMPPVLPIYSNASDEVRDLLFAPQENSEGIKYRYKTLSLYARENGGKSYFNGLRVGSGIISSASAIARARHTNPDVYFAGMSAFYPKKSLKDKPDTYFEDIDIDRKWGRMTWLSREKKKIFPQSAGGIMLKLKKGSPLMQIAVESFEKKLNISRNEIERRLVGKYIMPLTATDLLLTDERMMELKGGLVELKDGNSFKKVAMVLETAIASNGKEQFAFAILADSAEINRKYSSE